MRANSSQAVTHKISGTKKPPTLPVEAFTANYGLDRFLNWQLTRLSVGSA